VKGDEDSKSNDGKDDNDAAMSNWVLWIQTGERQKLIDDAVDNGAVVNPMEDRPNLGRPLFLSTLDRREANRRGYATPHDAWMARRRKELGDPSGPNTGPSVVFWPKAETLEEQQWLLWTRNRERQKLIDLAIDKHAVINPMEDPPRSWRFEVPFGDGWTTCEKVWVC